jgi:hypothetical protein
VHERVRAAEVRDDTQTGLGHAELHVVGDDAQVAGERELESGADGVALHRSDGEPRGFTQPREAHLEGRDRGVGLLVGQRGEAADARLAVHLGSGEEPLVETGGECAAGTAHHHYTDLGGQGLPDRPERLPRERGLRVQHLGSRERDRRPRTVDVERQPAALEELRVDRRRRHDGRLPRGRNRFAPTSSWYEWPHRGRAA